jgi:hypothetical protein
VDYIPCRFCIITCCPAGEHYAALLVVECDLRMTIRMSPTSGRFAFCEAMIVWEGSEPGGALQMRLAKVVCYGERRSIVGVRSMRDPYRVRNVLKERSERRDK